jgi:hypothetical protein
MWIITAWHRMSPEVTGKGFKKCFVYAAMYAGMMWNGSEEDGDVRSV